MRGEHNRLRGILSLAALAVTSLSLLSHVFASATDGTIDAGNRYAWSENAGWIDFGSTEGGVHVTDTALTGYAWGENVGWISLNCSNTNSCGTVDYKVTNDGAGTLGGNAWSENFGWIQFAPTHGGVSINSSGVFSGYAWGENVGWISFNCSDASSCTTVDYKVSTDWRPSSTRSASSSSSSTQAQTGGGGGGGGARTATLNNRLKSAQAAIFARYGDHLKQQETYVLEGTSSAGRSKSSVRAVVRREPATKSSSSSSRSSSSSARVIVRRVSPSSKPPEASSVSSASSSASQSSSAMSSVGSVSSASSVPPVIVRTPPTAAPPSASSALSAEEGKVVTSEKRDRLVAFMEGRFVLYKDVPVDAWFSPYVSYLVEEKIATGYADEQGKPKGEFGVGNPVTYAEVLKMALETVGADMGGLPPPRNISAKGTWVSAYVAKAEALHLSVFIPTLNVHTPATRGAVIETLLEVLGITIGKTPATYEDVPKNHPYSTAIAAATFFGLVQGDLDAEGKPLNRFRPDDPINRAEVAKIIALAKELMK